ncbi:hypothetical protein FACS1894139_16810 [Planctomycetales bacterium]|nr:hypothetical protein FACS1894108_13260 [Planctomycetales bacterium]GHT07866.1 hypothetical protein FACS1894139_16810 [Planctomycetales bacterium]
MTDEPLEKKIEEEFENAFRNATAVNPVFPYAAKQQMAQMVEEIAANNGALKGILNTDQTSFAKGGFAAEEWHAHGFNLDAILKDSENRAQPLRTTDPAVDIVA